MQILPPPKINRFAYLASGDGLSWNFTTFGRTPLSPSTGHGVELAKLVHSPRPFHPGPALSIRGCIGRGKNPIGYGTRRVKNLPVWGFRPISESELAPPAYGTFFTPMP